MRVLAVHPSALMHSEVFLRLEPLGLERVAEAIRAAGHEVRLLDLQVFPRREYFTELRAWRPEAVAFSLNYLANIPEVLDLAKATKRLAPDSFVFAGGHSVSFVADEVLEHAGGAIDCVLRGEGEVSAPLVLEAARGGDLLAVPGAVTRQGRGPEPLFVDALETHPPARDLTRRRRKYFIGHLDPSASIEFTRGCPWDCSFCSAWTFYGRSYRKVPVEAAVEEMASIREPNVFIVDDVAFVDGHQGDAIAEGIERRRIRKHYYLETRADVLLRHPEVFERWARLGLDYMFLGVEALDEEGLRAFRKRSTMSKNFEALDRARRMGIDVAINIIADPDWDGKRFEALRAWAMEVPEMVHVTVQTPYPGTEIWHTESRKLTTLDYRLFDVQHAVLPTRLPLQEFYQELVKTQSVLNRKHLGMKALVGAARIAADCLRRGQTNFVTMLWKFPRVYNAERQFAEHRRPVAYAMRPPEPLATPRPAHRDLYVHAPVETARVAG